MGWRRRAGDCDGGGEHELGNELSSAFDRQIVVVVDHGRFGARDNTLKHESSSVS